MAKNRTDSTRQLKVSESIKQALAEGLRKGKFHTLDSTITISEVKISPDLKNATIYVIPLGIQPEDKKMFIENLASYTSDFRKIIAAKVNLRYCPDLVFKFDDLFEKANKIETLFHKIEYSSVDE